MRIPLSWLNDYVQVDDLPLEALRQRLTQAGLEVEQVEIVGHPGSELPWDPDKVLTAEVLAVRPHPNADRLVLVDVAYGGDESEVVVTGAPSLYARSGETDLHLKVAFAWEGAVLYDGHAEGFKKAKLKRSTIRGVPSRAMACSQKELGISEEADDIIYLPDDTPVGKPLVDLLGDTIFDFDIKGPFGHLQSVYGIAREIAALYNRPLKTNPLNAVERLGLTSYEKVDFVDVEIAAPDLCPRFTATMIRHVQVKPSPLWMQLRLQRAGMRPISNLVDITNYVMLELGQPLHAYDYTTVHARPGETQPAIIVRRAAPGEQMTTLDGVVRTFDDEMVLITDGAGPVGVGGVMGGLDSEVEDNTENVLLEAASFNFLNVRRTSQQLKLQSEAALRFGKRVDSALAMPAAARAAELMTELCDGVVGPAVGDVYPGKPTPRVVTYDPKLADRLLGIEIPPAEQSRILEALEFEVEAQAKTWEVTIPSYRQDVGLPVDLVEEIARVWGYDKFPMTLIDEELPRLRRNRPLEAEEHIRDLLVGLGLDEIITYSLIDPEDEARLHPDPETSIDLPGERVVLQNYLSPERSQMRRSLLPGALRTTWSNLRYLDRIAIFEIGRIYYSVGEPDVPTGKTGVTEPRHLSILLTGPRLALWWQDAARAEGKVDYFDLKGIVEAFLACLSLGTKVEWARGDHPAFHPGRCAVASVDGQPLGVLGEMHPLVREAYDLPAQPVVALEWDLEVLLAAAEAADAEKQVVPLSPYAPVHEDLALVVDEATPVLDVQRAIMAAGYPLVTEAALFDVYRGEQVEAGKKSLAFALSYQAPNRSLSEKDVRKLRKRLIKSLMRKLGATLRGQ
ncbi:MAG: phenylalanine--tRNA ligase subunit beta [Anaerolineae bacterium]|nr:phenylalanine--tRNA ligase subunit beta [Anaerolineae bacterium]